MHAPSLAAAAMGAPAPAARPPPQGRSLALRVSGAASNLHMPVGHQHASYSQQWAEKRSRRILLLAAHEHRKQGAAAVAQASPAAPALHNLPFNLVVDGTAEQDVAPTPADAHAVAAAAAPSAVAEDAAASDAPSAAAAAAVASLAESAAAGASEHVSAAATCAEKAPPSLPKPWHQMGTAERREYLTAVRDHHG